MRSDISDRRTQTWRKTTASLLILTCTTLAFGADVGSQAETSKTGKALSFLVVGDWGRDGSPAQRAVAAQMARTGETLDAKFIVSTGDNFYPDGVASVEDPQWQTSFEQVYTDSVLHNDWYVVLGNHDYHGNPQAEVDYTRHSQRWHMPARYYDVVKRVDKDTEAEFFFIDTSPFIDDYKKSPNQYALAGQDSRVQLAWLQRELAQSTARWKFVVAHHHIYSGGKRSTQVELERDIVPLLKKYGVQAYINGHEHDLQLIRHPGGKTVYIVSGTGSEHRPTGATEGTLFSASTFGFVALSLTAAQLNVQFIDDQGNELFHTSIEP